MTSRRDALREFYKLKSKEKQVEQQEEGEEEEEEEEGKAKRQEDVDLTKFDAKVYVDDIVQGGTIKELLHRHVVNHQEMYTLESEKKALVYNNYNRFMSTTNTISDLVNKLNPVISEFKNVEDNIGEINHLLVQTINIQENNNNNNSESKDLNNDRADIAKLLLNSPSRLKRLIELNQPDKAQELLDKLIPIFDSVDADDDDEEIKQKCLDICNKQQS